MRQCGSLLVETNMLAQKTDLKQNIISNFAGQGISFLVGLAVVPFYIKFLGVEGYGLVGFYASLQAIFNSFLDFGFSVTINRELARYAVSVDKINQTRDLVRTMEIGYWFIGLILGALVCLCAPLISIYWLHSVNIPSDVIRNVVVIMGFITFVQWPLTLYQGGLMGMQKMVLLNGVNAFITLLRGVGGVLLLWLFSSSLFIFFLWQLLVITLQVILTTYLFWNNLPPSDHAPVFSLPLLKSVWRFAAGITATSFFSFFLDYGDRVILSKILSLENFGYYSLATTLNDQLQLVNAQIYRALFPRFSSLAEANAVEALRDLYHKSSQFATVVLLPIAGTAVVFSSTLILLWTQDPIIANNVALIASFLFVGTILANLAGIPHALTLAYGWVSFGFYRSLIAFLVLIPLTITLSLKFAGVGAALAWVLFNLLNFIFVPWVVHQRILKGELKNWLLIDVGIPTFTSIAVLAITRWIVSDNLPSIQSIFVIFCVTSATFGFAVLAAKEIRTWVFVNSVNYLKKIRSLWNAR